MARVTAVVWFRRDLRVADHPALSAAADEGPVLPVYVDDQSAPPAGSVARRRRASSVAALRDSTDGALVARRGSAADVLIDLAREVGARRVHVTADLTPDGRRGDDVVAQRLADHGIELARSGTAYAVDPGTVLTGSATPYRVFTPFWRAWRERAAPPPLPVPPVRWLSGVAGEDAGRPDDRAQDADPGLDTPDQHRPTRARPTPVDHGCAGTSGEEAALARWREFLAEDLPGYAEDRDRPDLAATSRMSAHLAWGEIHPRTMLADLAEHPARASEGAQRFAAELCWREFCADLLWHHPTSAWSDLRGELADLEHDPDGPHVAAWREGRTGFPFVDAGMRQLRARGWMHNRARMVTASFLVKDLHVRWQVGARHFLDHLVDGDLASNNANWQWVAGTGTDAAPYFRIFNPVRQGLRFDPHGDYVRRWIPELAHLPGGAAHEPWRDPSGYAGGYPQPIVDHAEERREALARYERARGLARHGKLA